jgi:hypothetical protein
MTTIFIFLSPAAVLVRQDSWRHQAVVAGAKVTNEGSEHMAKFMFIYRRGEDAGKLSPEAMQQSLEKWSKWIAEGFKKGWMLDAGDGLKNEGRFLRNKNVVTDGPFVEAKEIVGGYSIVQADTIEAATEHAKGCPVFDRGGSVEVRLLAGFNMQALAGH